ncbi:MAG TPA: alpha/beta fold hydrolase [Ktedonobacterales bacterium]|jgi:pimeloyl-ACP methyl ester carboxylesterase
MPKLRVNGAELYYEDVGSGPQTIIFAHGLLWSCRMFDAQIAALKDCYRCVSFDFRGQGQTEVTKDGYDMDTLYEDAAALIEALNLAPCHFAGLSMGGFIGMRMAARRPELLRSLILMETSADPEPAENIPRYRKLARVARYIGFRPAAGRVMWVMFGKTFMSDPARAADRKLWQQRMAGNDKKGILRALTGVIERKSIYDELGRVALPTLIMVGDEDVATVPAKAQRIHEAIAGSRLVTIPHAGHTSSVEQPQAVTAAIEEFLAVPE